MQTWFSPKLRMGNLVRIPWLQRKKPLAESEREGGGERHITYLRKKVKKNLRIKKKKIKIG